MPTKTEQETPVTRLERTSEQHGLRFILFWIAIGGVAFHAAYAWSRAGLVVGLYLFALVQLAKTDSWRKAFYSGLALGFLIAVGRLTFFWIIFSVGATALWLVYAFWIGLFVARARSC